MFLFMRKFLNKKVPRVLYIPVVSGDEDVCVLNSLFVVVLAVNVLVSVSL